MEIVKVSARLDVKNDIRQFGFDVNFKTGLNIISGHNSSGKSTIISSIYYCLGMEQLLGGNRASVLDLSLQKKFEFSGRSYEVLQSTTELTIKNIDREATLKRYIKSFDDESKNKIMITESGIKKSFFLHSQGDHERDEGFYKWLCEFIGIVLPKVEDIDNGIVKTIYLQNIFPCALIEQTKGWSDFFAQMPNFGIKDSKQKLVEFLLDLESLKNEFQYDVLKQKETKVKQEWVDRYSNIEKICNSNGLIIRGIDPDISSNTLRKIFSAKLRQAVSDDALSLDSYIEKLIEEKNVLVVESKNITSHELSSEVKKNVGRVRYELSQFNRQLGIINKEIANEKLKFTSYKDSLKKINIEIQRIDSAIKLEDFYSLSENIENCPLCDHELALDQRLNIADSKIDLKESLVFLKSQRNLYESYFVKYNKLIEDFEGINEFISSKIADKKDELKYLMKDVNSVDHSLVRLNVYKTISIENDIKNHLKIKKDFEKIKSDLQCLLIELDEINDKKEDLKISDESDNIKINVFKEEMKRLLYKDYFYYTSNEVGNITIKNKSPSRLLPVVEIKGDVQNVRLSSSASDFIRVQWAFYLTLLKISKNHPGFVVFDEPGQHAMNLESMTSLLKYSSKINKQVIMCISKETRNDSDTKNYNRLLSSLDELYPCHLIDIDSNKNANKCISPLESIGLKQ